MIPSPLSSRITYIQPSDWAWHVWLDGLRVGTVTGDEVAGFIARDNNHRSIGDRYHTAEAAMQILAPVASSATT